MESNRPEINKISLNIESSITTLRTVTSTKSDIATDSSRPILPPPAVPSCLHLESTFLPDEIFQGSITGLGSLTLSNKAVVQGEFSQNKQEGIFVSKATLTLPDGSRFFLNPHSSLPQLRNLAVTPLPVLIEQFGSPINEALDISPFISGYNFSNLPLIKDADLTSLFRAIFSPDEANSRLVNFLRHISSPISMPAENMVLIKKALFQIWKSFQVLPQNIKESFVLRMISGLSDLRCGPDITRIILDLARDIFLASIKQTTSLPPLEVSLVSEITNYTKRVIQDLFDSINLFFGNMPDNQSTHQMSSLEFIVDSRFGALGHSSLPEPFISSSPFVYSVVELLVKHQFTMENLVKLLPDDFVTDWGNPIILELAERDHFDLINPPYNWQELPLRFFESDSKGNIALSYLGLRILLSRLFDQAGVKQVTISQPLDPLTEAVANRIKTKTLIPFPLAATLVDPNRPKEILFRLGMPDIISIFANSDDLNRAWQLLAIYPIELRIMFLTTAAFTADPNQFETFVHDNIDNIIVILMNPNNISFLLFLTQYNGSALVSIFKFLDPTLISSILKSDSINVTVAHVLAKYQGASLAKILNNNPELIMQVLEMTDAENLTVAYCLAEYQGEALAQILSNSIFNEHLEYIVRILVKTDAENWTVAHVLAKYQGAGLVKIFKKYPDLILPILKLSLPQPSVLTLAHFLVESQRDLFMQILNNCAPELVEQILKLIGPHGFMIVHFLAQFESEILVQILIKYPQIIVPILEVELPDPDNRKIAHVLASNQGITLAQILSNPFYREHPAHVMQVLELSLSDYDSRTVAHFLAQFQGEALVQILNTYPELIMPILVLRLSAPYNRTVVHFFAESQSEILVRFLDEHQTLIPSILAIKNREDGPSLIDCKEFPFLNKFLKD